MKDASISAAAEILSVRLVEIASHVSTFEAKLWKERFIARAEAVKEVVMAEWETNWKSQADGKALIDALYERYKIHLDKLTFKKRVARAMRQDQTETWRAVSGILSDALKPSPSS